jgi:NAD(P)-dependent dehydrogenase (short-subunit alcohol dehydrogenase family)
MLLINGASGAIGSTLLRSVAATALPVIGIARDPSVLQEVSKEFKNSLLYSLKEIDSEKEAMHLIDKIESESGQVITQYLHAAAIISRSDSPIHTSVADFRKTLEVNLVGAFVWNKAIISRMIQNNIPGSVLNMASQAARTGGFGSTTSYAASKGGLISMTKSFARFAATYGIRVNSISPGFVNNAMMTDGLSNQQIEFFEKKTLLNRLASNEEIASVCEFLLSAKASYITGENIEVSAGQVLG